MGTKVHNNYEDLITFTRASGGHALRPVSYGTELVTNGTFDSDTTGWASGGGANPTVSVSSGQAVVTATQTGSIVFEQTTTEFEVGKLYQIKVDVVTTTDSISVFNKASSSIDISALSTGTNVINYVATEAGYLRIGNVGAVFSTGEGFTVDNISVKEVTLDESDGTLTLFEHPDSIPRVEYDADGNRLGLLVEEARTNQFPYSLLLTGQWSKSEASLSANQATAPDGTMTASEMIPTASADQSFLNLNRSVTSGTTYTQSIFVKQKDTSWFQIAPSTGFAASYQNFNIATGSLGSGDVTSNDGSASIQNVGNGWYRCSVTMPCNATESGGRMVFVYMTGDDGRINTDGTSTPDGTEGVYVWGAQLEEGSFPTSYIKTTGSSATRSADVASIPVADFGYNQSEGTVFVEAQANSNSTNFPRFVDFRQDTSNGWEVIGDTGSDVRMFASNNGVDVNEDVIANVLDGSTMFKIAFAKAENDAAASGDGGAVVTDTSNGQSTGIVNLNIGSSRGVGQFANGHIKSIKYYPRRLTNAQLQDLTS